MEDVHQGAAKGTELQQAVKDEIDVIVERARAAMQEGRRDDAVASLADVFTRDDDDALARIASEIRSMDLTAAVLDSLRRRAGEAESVGGWLALGRAQRMLEGLEAAIPSFERAVALPDASIDAWFALLLAANELDMLETERSALDRMLPLATEPEMRLRLLVWRVRMFTRHGLLDNALRAYGELADAWSESTHLRVDAVVAASVALAVSLHTSLRNPDAREVLGRIDVAPVDLELRSQRAFALGSVELALGDLARAIESFGEQPPAEPEDFRWGWYVARGLTFERLGRFADAERVFREANERMGPIAAQNLAPQFLARVLVAQNKLDEARSITDSFPIDSLDGVARVHALNSRGLVRLKNGDHAAALADFRAARGTIPPLDPEFDFNASVALYSMDRFAESVEQLERLDGLFGGLPSLEVARLQMLFGGQMKLARIDDAIESLDRAAALAGPHAPDVLALRARLTVGRRPPAEVVEAFARATPLAGDRDAGSRLRLEGAVAATLAKDHERAEKWVDEALAMTGEQHDSVWAEAAFARAALDVQRGDSKAALALLRRIQATDVELASVPRFLTAMHRALVHVEGPRAALAWVDELAARLGSRFASYVALLRGETLGKLGDWRGAESTFAGGARLAPELRTDPIAVVAALRCAILAGDPDSALTQSDGLRDEPALAEVREEIAVLRGSALFMLERGPDALAAFESVSQARRAGDVETRVMYAQALTMVKRHRDALRELDAVVETEAAPPALLRVVHANRALAFVALEEREHADEAADRVLAGFDSSDANELMAAYLARHAKAMALFGEARSHLHTSEKARRKAEKALKQLRELARDVDASPLASSAGMRKIRGLVWFAAAGTAYVLDKDDDAVGYCDNAIAAGAPSPAVWNLKGGVHLVLADYERARLAFGEVLASKADGEPRFEALSGVGRAHHHLGEYDVAVDYYRRALAEPCDDARTDSVVMQRLAEAYDELGRHPAALHAYRRAWARIKDRKRPARLVTGISAMLLRLNQPEEARAFIERERDAADHDRSIDFNLALAYARLDQRQRAIEIAEGIKDWKPAQQLLDALARTGGRDWIAHWFAKPGSGRSWAGALLLVVACLAFFAPPLFQLWREGTIGVEHALPLGAIALALFILPVAKSLSVEVPGLKLGVEPASRGDEDGKAFERIMPASLTAALRSPALAAGSEAPTAASDRASLVQDAEDMVLSAVRVRVAIEREDSGEGAESAEARGRERAKRLRSKR